MPQQKNEFIELEVLLPGGKINPSSVDTLAQEIQHQIQSQFGSDIREIDKQTLHYGSKGGPEETVVVALTVALLTSALPGLLELLREALLRRKSELIVIKFGDTEIHVPRDISPEELDNIKKALLELFKIAQQEQKRKK